MLYNRVEYLFEWNGLEVEVSAPINWEEDEKSFERHSIFHGISVNVTAALSFVKDAREFLINALKTDGPNANVKLTRKISDPQTDVMIIDYVGYVDFNTYINGEENFEVNLNTDPYTTRFKSKLDSQVELERLTSLKGTILQPINLKTLFLQGRAILITSKWSQPDVPNMKIRTFSNSVETLGTSFIYS